MLSLLHPFIFATSQSATVSISFVHAIFILWHSISFAISICLCLWFFRVVFSFRVRQTECNEWKKNRCESSSICIRNLCLHKLLLLLLVRNGEMDSTGYSISSNETVFAGLVVWHVWVQGKCREEKKLVTISTIRCSGHISTNEPSIICTPWYVIKRREKTKTFMVAWAMIAEQQHSHDRICIVLYDSCAIYDFGIGIDIRF